MICMLTKLQVQVDEPKVYTLNGPNSFFLLHNTIAKMHLMYTLDENGNRVYTLKVRRL